MKVDCGRRGGDHNAHNILRRRQRRGITNPQSGNRAFEVARRGVSANQTHLGKGGWEQSFFGGARREVFANQAHLKKRGE